jgi:hypothetical protein
MVSFTIFTASVWDILDTTMYITVRSLLQLPALNACCFCACKVCSCFFLTILVEGPHIHSSRYLSTSRFHWIMTNLQACLQTYCWWMYYVTEIYVETDLSNREKKKHHEERILQEYCNCLGKCSLATLLHKSCSIRNVQSEISASAMTETWSELAQSV